MEDTQTMPLWKPGDECLFRFRHATIRQVDVDGNVRSISDGSGHIGSSRLNEECFPVNARNIAIAAMVNFYYERIYGVQNNQYYNLLYVPTLKKMYSNFFVEAIKNTAVSIETIDQQFQIYEKDIVEELQKIESIEICGYQLFAR